MSSKPAFVKEYKEAVPDATPQQWESAWQEERQRQAAEREEKRLAAEREEKAAEREEKRLAAEAEREEKRLAAEAAREEKRLAAEREEKRLAAEREEKRLAREFELEKLRISKQSIDDGTFSCRSCNLHAVCSRVSLLAAVVCVLISLLTFLCLPVFAWYRVLESADRITVNFSVAARAFVEWPRLCEAYQSCDVPATGCWRESPFSFRKRVHSTLVLHSRLARHHLAM
jgi:hypothetical protein